MIKRLVKIFLGIAIVAVVATALIAGYFRFDLSGLLRSAREVLVLRVDRLKEIERQIITPSPLRGPTEEVFSHLTFEGVVEQTNIQRQQNGLPLLSVNAKLSAMAQAKVDDMFNKQYFAHNSPTGEGPSDLAIMAGYDYLAVGENLALGNYKDDQALVAAWMNSPGHRENILHSGYTEIGVAVQRDIYEGGAVWMAVQEFGRPTSDCPLPNEALGAQITENYGLLAALEQQLKEKNNELKSIRPKRGDVYNQKAQEYNELVNEYNGLVESTEALVIIYNKQVQSYNTCVSGI